MNRALVLFAFAGACGCAPHPSGPAADDAALGPDAPVAPGGFAPSLMVGDQWVVRIDQWVQQPFVENEYAFQIQRDWYNYSVTKVDSQTRIAKIHVAGPGKVSAWELGDGFEVDLGSGGAVPVVGLAPNLIAQWPAFPVRDGDYREFSEPEARQGSYVEGGSAWVTLAQMHEGAISDLEFERWEAGRPWWSSAVLLSKHSLCPFPVPCISATVVQWGGPLLDKEPDYELYLLRGDGGQVDPYP